MRCAPRAPNGTITSDCAPFPGAGQVSNVEQLFRAIDTDKGGSIDRAEFDAALARLGLGLSARPLPPPTWTT